MPSLLLCDFANLESEIRQLESAGYSALHLDVMDGVFVPNFTYGMTIVEAVRSCTELPVDVHLMMVEPEKHIQAFCDAGADTLTIHAEATDRAAETLQQIRELDLVAGVAINPATPVSKIEVLFEFADLVTVMSVNAGFGGQQFDPSVLTKLTQLRSLAGDETLLQIDGGINNATIRSASEHGAELLVAGSAVFNSDDYSAALQEMNREMGVVDENHV